MHEYPLVKTIISTAEARARENGAERVRRIALVVGDQSGYVPDSIQMYFDLIAADTLCAGARLDIRRVKPKLRCTKCGALFERRPFRFDCPDCGADGVPTDIGRELYIETIDIDRVVSDIHHTRECDETPEPTDDSFGGGNGTQGQVE